MLTDNSLLLRDYFFPRINLKNSNEFKKLYAHFQSIQKIPIHVSHFKEGKKYTSIQIESGFAPQDILKKTYSFKKSTIQFTFNQVKCTVNIYDEQDIQTKLINELLHIIQFVGSLSDITIQNLILNIYLLDDKKRITQKTKELDKKNVNSGSCLKTDPVIITIYRKEELIKVVIHELIHAFDYDNFEDNEKIIKHYQKKYNISSLNINTNEAYTEIWANLINCYLISQKKGRNQYNLFLVLVALESEFANFQAQKVLYLTKLNEKKMDINKYTNVLAYYIIRSEIYNSINLFLKFCNQQNEDYIKLRKEEEWFKFLKKNRRIMKNNRRFNTMKKNDYLFTTMRMSLNEIDI